jgi:hypothetical protein
MSKDFDHLFFACYFVFVFDVTIVNVVIFEVQVLISTYYFVNLFLLVSPSHHTTCILTLVKIEVTFVVKKSMMIL